MSGEPKTRLRADGFLTVREVAQRLAVSQKSVRRDLLCRLVPAVKIAGHWLVPESYITSLEDEAFRRLARQPTE